MITDELMTTAEPVADAELVSRTLAGDRGAFDRIVSRYQILVCSLAYSRIGHLGQSEDVAQETFITAWKHLRLLRQPEKLRSWLCGIVRNRARKCLQHESRQPVSAAQPLETVMNSPADVALPSEQTISREEEALLWRALEKIPELYREPLILFYREHQSIESVAAELELSEDAVKQRLSRGRKMLHEEIESFVQNALSRTAPTNAFASATMAALPLAAGSATTAGVGAAGKGGLAAKGIFAAFLLPFIGIFAGFGAQWLMFQGENGRAKRLTLIMTWVCVLTFAIGGQALILFLGHHFAWSDPIFFAAMAGFWWFFGMCMATWITRIYRRVEADCRALAASGMTIPPGRKPMTPFVYAGIVAGTHLMMFWGILFQAWREADRFGAALIAGLMTAVAVWNYFRFRDRAGSTMGTAYLRQLASSSWVMLAAFNLRFDAWLAHGYGLSVSELHQRLPLWMVPALTLVLGLWTLLILAITKPKGTDSQTVRS